MDLQFRHGDSGACGNGRNASRSISKRLCRFDYGSVPVLARSVHKLHDWQSRGSAYSQRLIDCIFEAIVALFNMPFSWQCQHIPRRFHPIVRHQSLIPGGKGLMTLTILMNGCTQVIGSVHLGYSTYLPEPFSILRLRPQAFTETHTDGSTLSTSGPMTRADEGKAHPAMSPPDPPYG